MTCDAWLTSTHGSISSQELDAELEKALTQLKSEQDQALADVDTKVSLVGLPLTQSSRESPHISFQAEDVLSSSRGDFKLGIETLSLRLSPSNKLFDCVYLSPADAVSGGESLPARASNPPSVQVDKLVEEVIARVLPEGVTA